MTKKGDAEEEVNEGSVTVGEGKEIVVPLRTLKLTVNGGPVELVVGHDCMPWHTLAYTLRERLGLTGTKIGCDRGECGVCTVLIDDKPAMSCTTLTVECEGKRIETIEGLMDLATRKLHPIQEAFIEEQGFQCGFCTPGAIMTAKALLTQKPNPTIDEVREAMSGIMCRCTGFIPIFKSVLKAAEKMSGGAE